MMAHLSNEQVNGYIHQTLSDDQRETIDRHISECAVCLALLDHRKTLQRRIQQEMAAELKAARPSPRMTYSAIAPRVRRHRRSSMLWGRSRQLVSNVAMAVVLIAFAASVIALFSSMNVRTGVQPTVTAGETEQPVIIVPTATATPPVKVARDMTYTLPLQPGAHEWLIDVYVPAAAGDWPAVVVMEGALTRQSYGHQILAQTIAEQGAVVFVASLSDVEGTEMFTRDNGAGLREDMENGACAVRFARATASQYGGRSDRVIVIGSRGGGWTGLMISLIGDDVERVWDEFAARRGGSPRQLECTAGDGVSGRPDALIGYAGAYLWFDQVKNEDPDLFKVVDPNSYIGSNRDVVLRLIQGERDVIAPKWHTELVEQLHQALIDAGYDATWQLADAPHELGAAARLVVFETLKEVVNR